MGPTLDGVQAPYTFPAQKLKRRMTQPGKTPLVLVACGSFSRTYSVPAYLCMCLWLLQFG